MGIGYVMSTYWVRTDNIWVRIGHVRDSALDIFDLKQVASIAKKTRLEPPARPPPEYSRPRAGLSQKHDQAVHGADVKPTIAPKWRTPIWRKSWTAFA